MDHSEDQDGNHQDQAQETHWMTANESNEITHQRTTSFASARSCRNFRCSKRVSAQNP
jgi:hypothetical protein